MRGHTFPPPRSHALSLGTWFRKISRSRSRITASTLLPRPRLLHRIEGTDEMLVGRVGEIKDRSPYLLFLLRTAAADDVPAPYSTLRLTSQFPLRRYKGTKEQIMSDLVLQNIK